MEDIQEFLTDLSIVSPAEATPNSEALTNRFEGIDIESDFTDEAEETPRHVADPNEPDVHRMFRVADPFVSGLCSGSLLELVKLRAASGPAALASTLRYVISIILHAGKTLQHSRTLARICKELDLGLLAQAHEEWSRLFHEELSAFADSTLSNLHRAENTSELYSKTAFVADLYAFDLISHSQFQRGVGTILLSPSKATHPAEPFMAVIFYYIARGQTYTAPKISYSTWHLVNSGFEDLWNLHQRWFEPDADGTDKQPRYKYLEYIREFLEILRQDIVESPLPYSMLPYQEIVLEECLASKDTNFMCFDTCFSIMNAQLDAERDAITVGLGGMAVAS